MPPKMKTARRLSFLLLLLAGIPSLYTGISLIADPTGSSVRFPFPLLRGTIFRDYMMIGWILTVTVGVGCMLLAVCVLLKTSFYSFGLMLQGIIICMYVFIMMLLLGKTFLVEYLFLCTGMAMVFIGLVQYQRKIASDASKSLL